MDRIVIFRRPSGDAGMVHDVAINERAYDDAKLPALPGGIPQQITIMDRDKFLAKYSFMRRIESME